MAEVLFEALLAFIAWAIYGTEARPRRAIWPWLLRVVVFVGGGATLAVLFFGAVLPVPTALAGIAWLVAFLVLLAGEFEFGNRRVGVAALIMIVPISAGIAISLFGPG